MRLSQASLMMNPSPIERSDGNRLLSIVVPTKNRANYALACIRHLEEIRDSDVEFVIYDNSSNEELQQAVRSLPDDPRLIYVRDPETIDVVENFERATRCAGGEYITHLGDDDGVSLEIVKCARMARKLDADAVVCRNPAFYFWPGHRFYYYGQLYAGSLSMRRPTGRYRRLSAAGALNHCLRHGGQDFGNLPKSYQGMVRRSAMARVLKLCGRYFPGPSPDLAGGAALACCIESYIELDFPFIIVGTSSVSTAGLGSRKAHIGRLEDWPHLPSFAIRNWSEIVPRFFSGRTIWAEDVVQGLRACRRDDLVGKFGMEALYGYCLACHPDQWKEVVKTWRENVATRTRLGRAISTVCLAGYYFSYHGRRVASVTRVLGDIARRRLTHGVGSIEAAGRVLGGRTAGVLAAGE